MSAKHPSLIVFLLAFVTACSDVGNSSVPESTPESPPATLPTQMLWEVEDIDGGGVVDGSAITIEFPEAGRVAGRGGCNRYFGNAVVEGNSVSFSSMGATHMACAADLMDQEQRFFETMQAIATFRVDGNSSLLLADANGEIRIRAISTDEPPDDATRSAPN